MSSLLRHKTAGGFTTLASFGLTNATLKQDRYRKVRGGKAQLLLLTCASCGNPLLVYQKDGTGPLLRCYANRIFWPESLADLQRSARAREPVDLEPLICSGCGVTYGRPMRHQDERLAFHLVRAAFVKRRLVR